MTLEYLAEKFSISSTCGDVGDDTLRVSEELIDILQDDDCEDIEPYELEICW